MTDDKKLEALAIELKIVNEVLNHLYFPPEEVEATYEAQARRVLKKYGLEHWKINHTHYVYDADKGNVQ